MGHGFQFDCSMNDRRVDLFGRFWKSGKSGEFWDVVNSSMGTINPNDPLDFTGTEHGFLNHFPFKINESQHKSTTIYIFLTNLIIGFVKWTNKWLPSMSSPEISHGWRPSASPFRRASAAVFRRRRSANASAWWMRRSLGSSKVADFHGKMSENPM